MEVFVHIIRDLNRFLNLGLYILVDSSTIMVNSLTLNANLLSFNASQTMDCYLALMDLKQKITSWANNNMMERYNVAAKIQGQIFVTFKFDISKHYEIKKYGNY